MAAIKTAFIILILSVMTYGNEGEGSNKVFICNIQFYSTLGEIVGNFTLEDLDPNLCTHIIYSRARIDERKHDIISYFPSIDLYDKGGEGMFNRTMQLKEVNPKLKVILNLFYFEDTFWDNSTMSYDVIISTFTKNAVVFLESHGFDGIYITLFGHPEEQRLFTALREEFDKRGLLLLTFLFPVVTRFETPIITQENSGLFDMVLVFGGWKVLYNITGTRPSFINLRKLVSDAQEGGLPSEKIVVMIETLAERHVLCNKSDNGISTPICGPIGEMTYSQLMYKIKNKLDGWVVQRDNETGIFYGISRTGVHQWTTFEDPVSVRAKAQYVLEENLAGIAIMTVDVDDVEGYNEEGVKLLLTKTAHNALRGN